MSESITGASLQYSLIEFLRGQGYTIEEVDKSSKESSSITFGDTLEELAMESNYAVETTIPSSTRRPDLGHSEVYRNESGELRDVMGALLELFKLFAQAELKTQAADAELKMEMMQIMTKMQMRNALNMYYGAKKSANKMKELLAMKIEIYTIEILYAIYRGVCVARQAAGDPSASADLARNEVQAQAFKEGAKAAVKQIILFIAVELAMYMVGPNGPLDNLLKTLGVPRKTRKMILLILTILIIIAAIATGGGAAKAAAEGAKQTAKQSAAQTIRMIIRSIVRSLTKAVQQGLKQTLKNIGRAIVRAVVRAAIAFAKSVKNVIKSIIRSIVQAAKSFAKMISRIISKIQREGMRQIIMNMLRSIGRALMAMLRTLGDVVRQTYRAIKATIKSIIASLRNFARVAAKEGIGAAVKQAIRNMVRSLIRAIKTAIANLKNARYMGAGRTALVMALGVHVLQQSLDLIIDEMFDNRKDAAKAKIIASILLAVLAIWVGGKMGAGGAGEGAEQAAMMIAVRTMQVIQQIQQILMQIKEGFSQLEEAKRNETIALMNVMMGMISDITRDQSASAGEFRKMMQKATAAINKAFDARVQAFQLARQSAA